LERNRNYKLLETVVKKCLSKSQNAYLLTFLLCWQLKRNIFELPIGVVTCLQLPLADSFLISQVCMHNEVCVLYAFAVIAASKWGNPVCHTWDGPLTCRKKSQQKN